MPFKGCLSDACVLMKIERFVLKPLRKIERFVLKQRTFRFADYSSELDGLEVFIKGKITQIQQGITGRKFTFQEGEWRLHLTFFPTNCVVDERYALKNKFIKQRK